jgi:sialic acid synthase SpsE
MKTIKELKIELKAINKLIDHAMDLEVYAIITPLALLVVDCINSINELTIHNDDGV